jgi:hypothetical protein
MKRFAFFTFIALVLARPGVGNAQEEVSLDPDSPSVDANVTPDDVLTPGPPGPNVATQGTNLGLTEQDNLNALSSGSDPIEKPLLFSVDGDTVGLPGTAVNAQSLTFGEEAQGDIFRARRSLGGNYLFRDEQQLGFQLGDDVDALSSPTGPDIYFSIDTFTSNSKFGAGDNASKIFAGSLSSVFADAVIIGIDPLDDIDALVLLDLGTRGVVDPGIDVALFSLGRTSPSTFTSSGNSYSPGVLGSLSPADILISDFTGSGGVSLFAPAADLGLKPDDNVNALSVAATPEPTSYLIWSLFSLVILLRKRRGLSHLV